MGAEVVRVPVILRLEELIGGVALVGWVRRGHEMVNVVVTLPRALYAKANGVISRQSWVERQRKTSSMRNSHKSQYQGVHCDFPRKYLTISRRG